MKRDWGGGKSEGGEEEGKMGRSCLPILKLFDCILYVEDFVLYL